MIAWELLGVPSSADIRAIKRAYAQKLKIMRPEDDLGAFTALRQAYDFAMDAARHEVESANNQVDAAQSEPATLDSSPSLEQADNIIVEDQPDIATVLNELYARTNAGEVSAAILWLQESDAYVNLNFQRALGMALIEDISEYVRWPSEALKAFGRLWHWLTDDNFCLYQPTSQFEILIIRTWIRTVGEPICNRFLSEAKTNIAAASVNLNVQIANLEAEFRHLVPQVFAWHLVNERHHANVVLALEEIFGWHHTVSVDAFGAALHRARIEQRVGSMTRRDNLKRMVPRHRAMWKLKFRRGHWGVLRSKFDSEKTEMHKILLEAKEFGCDLLALFDKRQVQFFCQRAYE